ncbi:hypothetical protein Tco_0948591 [Tanacetum coccineum]
MRADSANRQVQIQQRGPNRGRRRAEADRYRFSREVRTKVAKEQNQAYTDSAETSAQRPDQQIPSGRCRQTRSEPGT